MKNKKGYTMGIYFTWLFVGIIIGMIILWYVISQGWLGGIAPTPPVPPA